MARRDEAEVTSTSSSFPVVGTWYTTNTRWSHSLDLGYTWAWDTGAGYIYSYEEISPYSPWLGDTYNRASGFTDGYAGYQYYPNKSAPSGVPLSDCGSAMAGAGPVAAQESGVASEDETLGLRSAEALITSEASLSLHYYVAAAEQTSDAVATIGPSRGVVTFERPVEYETVLALIRSGVEVTSMEGVTTAAADGTHYSFFGVPEEAVMAAASGDAAAMNVTVDGITAVVVTVPSEAEYRVLKDHPDVYLVDLSITQFERDHPTVEGVVQDDVYWQLVGWDR